jgi:hypothetical protein
MIDILEDCRDNMKKKDEKIREKENNLRYKEEEL